MSTNDTLPTELCRTLQVGQTTFEYFLVPLGDYVDAGLMTALGHFAQEIGLPNVLRHFVHIR